MISMKSNDFELLNLVQDYLKCRTTNEAAENNYNQPQQIQTQNFAAGELCTMHIGRRM